MGGVAESFYPAETAEHIKPLIYKKLPDQPAASLNINRPPHKTWPDATRKIEIPEILHNRRFAANLDF
jgi:hypothetical protein